MKNLDTVVATFFAESGFNLHSEFIIMIAVGEVRILQTRVCPPSKFNKFPWVTGECLRANGSLVVLQIEKKERLEKLHKEELKAENFKKTPVSELKAYLAVSESVPANAFWRNKENNCPMLLGMRNGRLVLEYKECSVVHGFKVVQIEDSENGMFEFGISATSDMVSYEMSAEHVCSFCLDFKKQIFPLKLHLTR